ncbi:hypothetical protein ASE93_18255 [Serratia sp. Leaf50]|nr:hypothetical protein ASE93_18255 [Serratia sp. Leaf50]
MLKLSKSGLLGLILAVINPIVAFAFVFLNIKRKNSSVMLLSLSICVFTIFCFVPPYQDLYRRYIDTYLSYNNNSDYSSVIQGHVDILMYVISLFMKRNDIPFYFFPAVQAGIVTYLFLSTINDLIDVVYKGEDKKVFYLVAFLFINVIAGALGLRFYIAIALVTKGITVFYFKENKKQAIIYCILSLLFHFSMAVVVMAFIASNFIKLNKKFTPLLFIAGFITSSVLLLFVINSGWLGFIGQYVKAGYIDFSGNADVDTKGNAVLVLVWRYILVVMLFFVSYFYKFSPDEDKRVVRFINFVNVFLVVSSLTALSATAFNRYLIAVGSFLLLLNFFIAIKNKRKGVTLFNMIFTIVFIVNFLFQNIYLQRRPLMLGEMWRGLYTPSLIAMTRSDDDFKLLLKEIDDDGDWVKDKLASK